MRSAIPMISLYENKFKQLEEILKVRVITDGRLDNTMALTYSSTPKLSVNKTLIIIGLSKGFKCILTDIRTAFLNAPLDQGNPIYVRLPADIP